MDFVLGTAQFGLDYGIANQTGQIRKDESRKILAEAFKLGIRMLDTAAVYGKCEQLLGEMGVSSWQVISKLPSFPSQCSDVVGWVEEEVRGAVHRLGIKNLYAVLLHNPKQLFETKGDLLLKGLENLKKIGLVKKIGVSIYSPDELNSIFEIADFDVVQAPFNILDRRILETGWAQKLRDLKVELHTRSIFLQGLLLMPRTKRPLGFERWDVVWKEWENWLNELKISPLEACIRYVQNSNYIDKVVIGIDSLVQLHEILATKVDPLPSTPNWQGPVDIRLITPSLWNT